MKTSKVFRLYQEPTIKVVRFTIENGYAGSWDLENPGTDNPIIIPGDGDDDGSEEDVGRFGGGIFRNQTSRPAF